MTDNVQWDWTIRYKQDEAIDTLYRLNRISKRDYIVAVCKFKRNMKMKDIGKIICVGAERVRQLSNRMADRIHWQVNRINIGLD